MDRVDYAVLALGIVLVAFLIGVAVVLIAGVLREIRGRR